MKKNLFVILVMFAMINIQNLYAQKKHKLSTGTKTMEIVGEFTYNDDLFGKYYAGIQKDKVVLWRSMESLVVETSVKSSDLDANDKDAIMIQTDVLDENIFVVNFYCKSGKSCEQIEYAKDEKKIISKKEAGVLLSIKFKTKAEAQVFMAKAKKAMKK
jgi:hypothetical protein